MAENSEVENKLLRRILGKLVSAIEIELDAGSIEPTDWEKPIFEEAKRYATRVGVTFDTEVERYAKLEAELTQARTERDAAREKLDAVIRKAHKRGWRSAMYNAHLDYGADDKKPAPELTDEDIAAIKAAEGE
jgi:hypothetical protein